MENRARYIYGIAEGGKALNLGPVGIGRSQVYTIPCEGLCAIVHSCPAQPYQSADEQVVKEWVTEHQGVLDAAKQALGTVVPLRFDTILESKDDAVSPDQVVRDWIRDDYERLQSTMEKIRGRDEYGVQISYAPRTIARRISAENPEIRKAREEMATRPPGTAYLYKQKVERAVRDEIERLASVWFKEFHARVKLRCDDVVIEKTRNGEQDRVMLLNLSCLVAPDRVNGLGEELERIAGMEGFSVRFTGPWHPYSFAAKPFERVKEQVK